MTKNPRGNEHIKMSNLLHMGYGNGHQDATGILYKYQDKFKHVKVAGSPTDLFKNYSNLSEELAKSHVLIGHNRYTTVGTASENENNHPFVLDGFALIHNGTFTFGETGNEISNDYLRHLHPKINIDTDSFRFLTIFLNYFDEESRNGTRDRDKRVANALKRALACVGGKFSIFLTDLNYNSTYYIRNSDKMFYFKGEQYNGDWTLIGSTTHKNIDALSRSKKKRGVFTRIHTTNLMYEFIPRALKLYKITETEKMFDAIIKLDVKIKFDANIGQSSITTGDTAGKYDDKAFDLADFRAFYPNTYKMMEKHGMDYEGIWWYDGDYGGLEHNFTKQELKKFTKIAFTENIRVENVTEYYIEIILEDYQQLYESSYGTPLYDEMECDWRNE